MPKHREAPIKRRNPSGSTVWIARYTAPDGKRRSAGTYKLRRDAQDAINHAYHQPINRGTLGAYARDWTARHPRQPRTNQTNDGRLHQILQVLIDGRPLADWPLAELRRRHALELVDHMLREQHRAAVGATGILRTLSAMAEDAITDELMVGNPFRGVRVRRNDPRANAGVSPKVASVLMGHATPERQMGAAAITLARYTHALPDDIERARDRLAAYLAGAQALEAG